VNDPLVMTLFELRHVAARLAVLTGVASGFLLAVAMLGRRRLARDASVSGPNGLLLPGEARQETSRTELALAVVLLLVAFGLTFLVGCTPAQPRCRVAVPIACSSIGECEVAVAVGPKGCDCTQPFDLVDVEELQKGGPR